MNGVIRMSLVENKSEKKAVKYVIIIDCCPFSQISTRFALEMLPEHILIFSFDSFSEYKVWDKARMEDDSKCYIFFNTLSYPFYNDDIADFILYENQKTSEFRKVLFLKAIQTGALYKNLVLSHFYLSFCALHNFRVVDCSNGLNINNFVRLLTAFIKDENLNNVPYGRLFIGKKSFTKGEMRALKSILKGEPIQVSSQNCGVKVKTLYAQRRAVLIKLGLFNAKKSGSEY